MLRLDEAAGCVPDALEPRWALTLTYVMSASSPTILEPPVGVTSKRKEEVVKDGM